MSKIDNKQLQSDPNLRGDSIGNEVESNTLQQPVQTIGLNSPKVVPYDDGISPNVKH